jgi:D-glycero-D-manno-heptose 1,7-bisphosphate phosphatase
MEKAIFLDRDGVINVEKNYLYKIEDFEFVKGVIEALLYLQNLGYKLFVITNQSGIGRGYYSVEEFLKLTHWMVDTLDEYGVVISELEYCPHTPDENCLCRKPKTKMIENILQKYQIDLKNSWLIGDKNSDIECAKNAGINNTIHVKSGHPFDISNASFIIESLTKENILNIIQK